MDRPQRLAAPAWELVRQALGPADARRGKLARLAHVISSYAHTAELHDRLARLEARGIIDVIPSPVQLVVGSIDMLRFWISPAAADYYERRGIGYGFHQLLRLLEEPASLADPVGFFSTRDGIIGHLMQVVHANPVYDLQLLAMFDDGLEELERQLEQMLAGTHPRAATIAAIVEEADYHARLLEFVRAWHADPSVAPLLRDNVADSAEFSEIERTFGSLTTAMRYFSRLPTTPLGAAQHIWTVRAFPSHLA